MWKRLWLVPWLALLLCIGAGGSALAKEKADGPVEPQVPETPPAGAYVADYASVVSEADREAMAILGKGLQQKYGVLLICLTEDALEGAPLSLYADTVRTKWGLTERGCLMLFIRQGRRLHFANGTEVAGRLTKEQLDKAVAPVAGEMTQGNYSPALTQLYHNLVMTIAAAYGAGEAQPGEQAAPEEVPAEEIPPQEAPTEEAEEE